MSRFKETDVRRNVHETRPQPAKLPLGDGDYDLIKRYVASGVPADRLAWNEVFVEIVRRTMMLERCPDHEEVFTLYQRLLKLRKSALLPAIHHYTSVPLTWGPSRIGAPCEWETHLQRLEAILEDVGIPHHRVGLQESHTRFGDVSQVPVTV
jgi:hypothetical protein